MTDTENTIIFSDSPYGVIPRRTWWEILKAIISLKWWEVRFWLAKRGLFVRKIYINEEGEVFDNYKLTKRTTKI